MIDRKFLFQIFLVRKCSANIARSSSAAKRSAYLSIVTISLLVEADKEKKPHDRVKFKRFHINIFKINSIQDTGS